MIQYDDKIKYQGKVYRLFYLECHGNLYTNSLSSTEEQRASPICEMSFENITDNEDKLHVKKYKNIDTYFDEHNNPIQFEIIKQYTPTETQLLQEIIKNRKDDPFEAIKKKKTTDLKP